MPEAVTDDHLTLESRCRLYILETNEMTQTQRSSNLMTIPVNAAKLKVCLKKQTSFIEIQNNLHNYKKNNSKCYHIDIFKWCNISGIIHPFHSDVIALPSNIPSLSRLCSFFR